MAVRAVAVTVVLTVAVLLGVLPRRTPPPLPASAPAAEFSAGRAMDELSVIAARPHLTGTVAADAVRAHVVARLTELGFTVEVQDTTWLSDQYAKRFGFPVVGAHVRNVVARKRGTAPGPALFLTAHYDSRELAPGASDDGYGTAALLETARALSASGPLRHDLVVLITEGEEQGLLGARAFVAESSVAKDAGVVLNFEARGDAGPVSMFQTSEGAGPLIDVLARAAPYPYASSLSQEVYRRMPNDTDLTVWLRAGYAGMNFANVDGFARYHQPTDSLANVDRSTLQHHGSYALAMARALANRDAVAPPRGPDEVYFDAGPLLVHYAASESTTLALLAVGLFAIAAAVGVMRGRFRAGAILAGTGRSLVAVIAAAALGEGLWWCVSRATGGRIAMQVASAGPKTALCWGMMGLGAACAWLALTLRSRREEDVALGALVPWVLLTVVTAVALPGGSYLFAWPTLAACLAWCVRIGAPTLPGAHPAAIALHLVAAVAALYLSVPLILQLGLVFGAAGAPVLAALAASTMAAGVPAMQTGSRPVPALPPCVLAAAGLAAVGCAAFTPSFDATYPRPESLVYAMDVDRNEASWLSTDTEPDAWTSKAMGAAQRSKLATLVPRSKVELRAAAAPAVVLETPRIGILSDVRTAEGRSLRLRVMLPSDTEIASLQVPPEAHVRAARVQGRPFEPESDGWVDLAFFGPPGDGLELDLDTASTDPASLHIVAQTRGLPPSLAATLGPRPAGTMPAVVQWNALLASDMTLVASSFQL